nr:hypothetical protein [Armillaria spp. ambi-like virus 4]
MIFWGVCVARSILLLEIPEHSQVVLRRAAEERMHTRTDLKELFSLVYPEYRTVIRTLSRLPLSARNLLIKACQAQSWPAPDSFSTLRQMIEQHPDVYVHDPYPDIIKFSNFAPYFNLRLHDPLESAILLDIARGLPLPSIYDVLEAQSASWSKEIRLVHGVKREAAINWDVFFVEGCQHLSIADGVEPNPQMARRIHHQLKRFRESIRGRRFYPRATHKNMSRGTRRDFERQTGQSLEGIPIFGQDNWGAHYHHTGRKLGGPSEMRQKWYHSGAKPRTYFAMGGEAYEACRFLQDFFTEIVDYFMPTNHKTRLQPDRLFLSSRYEKEDPHFRIYDLSNFTSNMSEQSRCLKGLEKFMEGVEVEVVDERFGPLMMTMEMLLSDYQESCVERPAVSLERYEGVDKSEGDLHDSIPHMVASLLGIFGNLMSCTFAHYLIVSPVVRDEEEVNIAGDDGILPEDANNPEPVKRVIDLVGSCAMEKTFRSDEESAIALKRPIWEDLPHLHTAFNIIPPSVVRCCQSICSSFQDPRYPPLPEPYTLNEGLNIVGKDLLRFLRSAYIRRYQDVDRLAEVVQGYERLVRRLSRVKTTPGTKGTQGYTWPMSPLGYDFLDAPPLTVLSINFAPKRLWTAKLEKRPVYQETDLYVGLSFESNSSPKLKMLEAYGYIEKEEVMELLEDYKVLDFLGMLAAPVTIPVVYSYSVVRDVPEAFQGWV